MKALKNSTHLVSATKKTTGNEISDKYRDIHETAELLMLKIAGLPDYEKGSLTSSFWLKLLRPIKSCFDFNLKNGSENSIFPSQQLANRMNLIEIISCLSVLSQKSIIRRQRQSNYNEFIWRFCILFIDSEIGCAVGDPNFGEPFRLLNEETKKAVTNSLCEKKPLMKKVISYVIAYDIQKDGDKLENIERTVRRVFPSIFDEVWAMHLLES